MTTGTPEPVAPPAGFPAELFGGGTPTGPPGAPGGEIDTQSLSEALAAALGIVLGINPETQQITRKAFTSQPLVGLMPRWIDKDPAIAAAVAKGTVDPYMPFTDNVGSWQVYQGQSKDAPDFLDTVLPGFKQKKKKPAKPGDSTWWQGMTPPTGWGSSTDAPLGPIREDPAPLRSNDNTATVETVKNRVFLWSEDEVAGAIKRFQDAGITGVKDFESLRTAWGSLVERAGQTYSLSSGKIKMTPWGALEADKNARIASGSMLPDGPTTRTATTRTVSEISQGDAWSALQQTVSRMLGRDPETQEVRDFAYRMNALAARNPSISKTVQTMDAAGANTNTSTTNKAGFSANDVQQNAYEDAQSDPDYAEYQSASTYFNAALSALGSIGGN